jgi:hypothetical protein
MADVAADPVVRRDTGKTVLPVRGDSVRDREEPGGDCPGYIE